MQLALDLPQFLGLALSNQVSLRHRGDGDLAAFACEVFTLAAEDATVPELGECEVIGGTDVVEGEVLITWPVCEVSAVVFKPDAEDADGGDTTSNVLVTNGSDVDLALVEWAEEAGDAAESLERDVAIPFVDLPPTCSSKSAFPAVEPPAIFGAPRAVQGQSNAETLPKAEAMSWPLRGVGPPAGDLPVTVLSDDRATRSSPTQMDRLSTISEPMAQASRNGPAAVPQYDGVRVGVPSAKVTDEMPPVPEVRAGNGLHGVAPTRVETPERPVRQMDGPQELEGIEPRQIDRSADHMAEKPVDCPRPQNVSRAIALPVQPIVEPEPDRVVVRTKLEGHVKLADVPAAGAGRPEEQGAPQKPEIGRGEAVPTSLTDSITELSEAGGGLDPDDRPFPTQSAATPATSAQQRPLSDAGARLISTLPNVTGVEVQADDTLSVTLEPEDLGRLRISFQSGEQGTVLHVVAERAETVEVMKRHLDTLRAELRDEGFSGFSFGSDQEPGATSRDGGDAMSGDSFGGDVQPDPRKPRATADQRLDLRL